jgi:hypothetical protein
MHTLIRAHGAVAYREALFADETPYAAMEAMLPRDRRLRLASTGKSLRRGILGSQLHGWTDQRDREPFGFAVSVRRAPLAPTPTIGQATPLEGPSGA